MSFHATAVRTIDGHDTTMADFRGRAVLIVNVASQCGLTPQYAGLQALHTRLSGRGFAVLGFPCNQFGGQEPGTETEIREFCTLTYGVKFPMFAASSVRGDQANPFFRNLITQGAPAPKWNFYKYLIGRDGKLIESYSSMTDPDSRSLVTAIEKSLKAKP